MFFVIILLAPLVRIYLLIPFYDCLDLLSDCMFQQLPSLLPENCHMVVNDSRVFEARIFAYQSMECTDSG